MSQTPTGPIGPSADRSPSASDGPPSAATNEAIASDLERRLAASDNMSASAVRTLFDQGRNHLSYRFERGEPARLLIRDLSTLVDSIVRGVWHTHQIAGAALVAVGGYGRAELFPSSDVDILILVPRIPIPSEEELLQRLVGRLWDIDLEIGHSVRTVEQCVEQARKDITVATALLECRLLAGSAALFEQMRIMATGPAVMSSRKFFDLKVAEQTIRHRRFDETAYKLEPNVKESPGGLRDIQSIVWVAKHHFGASELSDLVGRGFLEPVELDVLEEGRNFLSHVRFALHTLTGRREDRLLFDHQRTLATQFGYQDDDANLAVEQFMQRYYRTARELQQLNELLLEVFKEANLSENERGKIVQINRRFRAINGIIETVDNRIFVHQPWTMLELFLLMEQRTDVTGISPATLRLLRSSRHRLDEKNRADIRTRSLFMEILRQPRGVTHALRHMHRHGVLAAYLPVFEQVSGKMQYDLFHIYTVDEHSLRVLANVRAYADIEPSRDLAALSDIFERIPKRELLYIAAIYHDIAKGRGGDHSDLGAVEAYEFCTDHGLGACDAKLVSWLVKHHLLMSMTAQREDISDPDVVTHFARKMGNRTHLDYLYLLTVADIRGTNPTLWNDWRASLLRTLFNAARRALQAGVEHPIDRIELVNETQQQARVLLRLYDPALEEPAQALWQTLGDDYFLRATPDEIAWHAQGVVPVFEEPNDDPLVLVRSGRSGTDVFIYAHDQEYLFAATCSVLDRLGLSILDSRIITADNGMTLDSYVVADFDGSTVTDVVRHEEIRQRLTAALRDPGKMRQGGTRMLKRQLKAFNLEASARCVTDEGNDRTIVELIAGDRPGLLARVGWVFADHDVRLQNARIATLGERAEDVFVVTNKDNSPLDAAHCAALVAALEDALSMPPSGHH